MASHAKYSIHIVLFCPYWMSNLTSLPITYSCPRESDKKGDVEVAAGQEVTVVEETYENQRWYPIKGWSAKLLRTERHSWSDRKGQCRHSKTKESFALPNKNEWAWQDPEWKIDDGIGDEEGWMYASTFAGHGHFKHNGFFGAGVRRRRWTRISGGPYLHMSAAHVLTSTSRISGGRFFHFPGGVISEIL